MVVSLATFALFIFPVQAKNCRKGIPCGNTCISANKTCRIAGGSTKSAPAYTAPRMVTPATPSAPSAPASSARPARPVERQKQGQITLHAYPSTAAPVTGYYVPGQELKVYGSAGDWILISPLDAPKHQWMLQHKAK